MKKSLMNHWVHALVGLCASIIFFIGNTSVGATCVGPAYQPEVPKALRK